MADLAYEKLCHHYSLADIQFATQNFDDTFVIGQGGFGKVYKGNIKSEKGSSTVVAIKRLDFMSNQGATEFKAEIEMLSTLRHSNLVSLLGCCVDGNEMIIVYEYMPRETVYHHLHKSNTPLSWLQRLKICIGAARGLDYLHTGAGTKHGIIHRDVKSSNILIDEDWAAKISDFGLAKLCPINQSESSTYVNTDIKGTFGYLDPETFMTGRFTRKTDVFAFGVVLFELLSGRHAVLPHSDEDLSLARWAQKCVKKGNLDQLVASEIREKLSPKSLKEFAHIAYRCLHGDPKERPTMSEVVVALQLSKSLQDKFDSSSQAVRVFGFSWKMSSYSVFRTKDNSCANDKKLSRNRSININCNSLPAETDGDHNNLHPESSSRNIVCDSHPSKSGGGVYDKVLPNNKKVLGQYFKTYSYNDLKLYMLQRQNKESYHALGLGSSTYAFEPIYAPPKLGGDRLHNFVMEYNFWTGDMVTVKKNLPSLREFCHPNLLRVVGYCLNDKTFYIVYKWMKTWNLWNYLRHKGTTVDIPFIKRVKIVVEVARVLVFFQCKQLNIKNWILATDDILYDEEFNAKFTYFIAGRWVKQISPFEKAMNSSYGICNGRLCDVFGLGMLLMEILTAKPMFTITEMYLAKAYLSANIAEMSNRMIKNLVDPRIQLSNAPEIEIARKLFYMILEFTRNQITMAQALKELEQLYSKMSSVLPSLPICSSDATEKYSSSNGKINVDCSPMLVEDGGDYNKVLPQMSTQALKILSYTDLICATSNFQNEIKWSGQGQGFKGWVHEQTLSPAEPGVGLAIFVKKYEQWTQTENLRLLGEFSHPNLHRLLGYCLEDGNFYIVYELTENWSLQDYLRKGVTAELSFITRVKIVVEVARVLVFFQRKKLIIKNWVLHSDYIWLDKEFNAKFVDFDVGWRVNQNRMGKYPLTGGILDGVRMCNVFGLGMLLMETLTAEDMFKISEMYLVQNRLRDSVTKMSDMMIKNLVDPRLKLNAPEIERARELLYVVLEFTINEKTMEQALEELEQIYSRMTRLRLQQESSAPKGR